MKKYGKINQIMFQNIYPFELVAVESVIRMFAIKYLPNIVKRRKIIGPFLEFLT
jgi:hypothetical protein